MKPLRVLGMTNFYPPAAAGGYGEICADVMRALAARGHDVTMLITAESARRGAPAPDEPVDVRPELDYVLAAWRHPRRGLRAVVRDQQAVKAAIARGVDVALVWHMRGVMKTSLRLLHEAQIPVLYMLHDRWVLYERPGPWLAPWSRIDRLGLGAARERAGSAAPGKLELRAPPIERDGIVCFVSEWLRREYARLGWRPRTWYVVPGGVDAARFRSARAQPPAHPPERLLFSGRIHPTKGLDVAVRALALAPSALKLSVAGPVDEPEHLARVRALAGELGVADRIEWLGALPRSSVVAELGRHDVVVHPSTGVEAGILGVAEALAAGALLVTSAPGAPRDYVRHGENALVFPPGDARALAHHLERLCGDPALARTLRTGGERTAAALSLDAVLDRVEAILADARAP